MDLQTALLIAKAARDPRTYREAIEYLIDHRDELQRRVYITLPSGRSRLAWQKVTDNSLPRCSCGNERIIMPANPRTDFDPLYTVRIEPGNRMYLRPIGGDLQSAAQFDYDGKALIYQLDPFAEEKDHAVNGWQVDGLPEAVGPGGVFALTVNGVSTPIFRINSVDPKTGVITAELDKDIDNFNPAYEMN